MPNNPLSVFKLALALPAIFAAASTHAVVYNVDLSPWLGSALNLGSNPYTRDHAIGLSSLNETSPPISSASGNEYAAGITYDNITNTLTFDIVYGSAFGYNNLNGNFTATHIHGAGIVNYPSPNTSAGVLYNLGGFHTASGPLSGRIAGSLVLSPTDEQRLIDNQLYINIHSAFAGGGELRGQFILVPEPSSLALLAFSGLMIARRRRG